MGPVCDDELVEFDVPTDFGPLPLPTEVDEETDDEPPVEVRRRNGVAALVGALAGGVATAYLARAVDSGSSLDWAVCALMALVAVAHLAALLDGRTPLLVADDQGVRLRMGRSWAGLTWGSLRRVHVTARAGLRDGRVVLVPRDAERVLADADSGARRSFRLARRLYGDPFTVPLSLASRVVGTHDIEAALRSLADGRTDVTDAVADELVPADVELRDLRTSLDPPRSRPRARHRSWWRRGSGRAPTSTPTTASCPSPWWPAPRPARCGSS